VKMHSKTVPARVKAVTAAMVVLTLAGCASSSPTVVPMSSPTVDTTKSSQPSAAPSSPVSEAVKMIHKWSYTYTTSEGYKFGGALEDGTPRHLEPGLTLDGLSAGSACTINPATDAVIPARFTATNYTKNFPAKVSESLGLAEFSGIQVEVGYSSGPMCIDGNNSRQVLLGSAGDLAEGQAVQVPMFFILSGYYTPAHPTGDPSVLKGATVDFSTNYPLQASGPGLAGTTVPLGG
jgi:hypothetical protein